MSYSWSVRTYEDGDEIGILKLMKLGKIEHAIEYWFWMYRDNPCGNLIGVAANDGQLVGHMALIPTRMQFGTKTIMGSQAVDLVVHPEFRHQGMFLAIGKYVVQKAEKEGIGLEYGFPNEQAHSGHLKYGWFDVCKVPTLVQPNNIDGLIDFLGKYRIVNAVNKHRASKSAFKAVLRGTLAIINSFSKIHNRVGFGNSDFEIQPVESFDDRIDSFWKKVSTSYPLAVTRDREYLNWRYFKNPRVKYTVFSAEKNNEILGYVVLRSKREEKLQVGYIVDVLASPDNVTVIQHLISKAVEHFKEENVDLIACRMLKNNPSSIYYRILRNNGFMPFFGPRIPLIARINSPGLSKAFVADSSMWYTTMGDSDHI